MRPLKLFMHGFTCFQEPVEIDFSDLELFAITGPTGAGKSSIVDALIFALYGKAPRVGSDVVQLISQGAEQMKVLLQFQAGHVYKIARCIHSGSSPTRVSLEVQEGNEWRTLSTRVRDVNHRLVDILGLNYEAFIRSTILPQGEFRRFLNEAKSRQQILANLLNLEIIARLQRRANREKDAAHKQCERIRERLDKDLADVSEQALKQLQQQQKELMSQITSLIDTRTQLEKECNQVREILQWDQEARQLLQVRQQLEQQGEQVAQRYQRLRRARLALPLEPLLKAQQRSQQRVEELSQRYSMASKRLQELQTQDAQLRQELTRAEEQALALPDIKRQLNALVALSGIIASVRRLNEKLSQEEHLQQREEKQRHQCQEEYEQLQQACEQNRAQLNDLRQEEQRLNFDQNDAHRIEQAYHILPLLKTVADEQVRCQRHLAQLQQTQQQAQQAQNEIQRRLETSQQRWQQAQQEYERLPTLQVLQQRLLEAERARGLAQQRSELMKQDWSITAAIEKQSQKIKELEKQKHEYEASLATLQQKRSSLEQKRQQLQTQVQEARSALQLYNRLAARLQELEQIGQQSQQQYDQCTQQVKQLQSQLATTQLQLDKARQKQQQAQEKHAQCQQRELAAMLRRNLRPGDACPVCGQKTGTLPADEDPQVQKAYQELQAATRQSETLQAEYSRTEQELHKLQLQQEALRQTVELHAAQQRECREERDRQQIRLQQLFPQSPADYQVALDQLEQQLQQGQQDLSHCLACVTQTQSCLAAGEATHNSLQQQIREQQEQLAHIRQEASQISQNIKTLTAGTNLEDFIQQLQKQQKQHEQVHANLMQAEQAYQQAQIEYRLGQEKCGELQTRLAQVSQELEEIKRRQEKHLAEIFRLTGFKAPGCEKRIVDKWRYYQQIATDYQQTVQRRQQVEEDLRKLELRTTREQTRLQALQDAMTERQERIRAWRAEQERLQLQINDVTKGEDPLLQQERLSKKQKELETNLQQLREQHLGISKQLALEDEQYDQLHQELQQARSESQEITAKLEEQRCAAGFSSLAELDEYLVPQETMDQWEREIQEYQDRLAELEGRLSRCRELLQGRSADPEQLRELEERLHTTQLAITRKEKESGMLTEKCGRMVAALSEVQHLQKELQQARTQAELASELARDLRADRFQAYILEEALLALCEDGSVQLEMLSSGRYAFTVEGRDFYVIDRWNADEIRPTKTLSGGETFLGSLALAVALAERIYQLGHKMGGGALLESLFLDEGFGMLDEEHLDIVVRALENLQGTGRLVGIITHLPELTAHLPVRLAVKKGRQGSRVFREGA